MRPMIFIQWIGFSTIIRKELSRIFRIWTQTLLPSVITTTLYFLIFGSFIGSRIGLIHGVPYIQFIVPGLIMMSVITNSYANVSSSFFGAKFQKNVEEMLVSPLKGSVIVFGFVASGAIRGCFVGFLVTLVSLIFSPIHFHHAVMVGATILMSSILFATAGFLNALFARKFDDISIVPTFVLTPLTYLGGVFYSIQSLPSFWQKVSLLNPIIYLINLFRFGFLGITDISVPYAFMGLSALTIGLLALAIRLMQRGVGMRS